MCFIYFLLLYPRSCFRLRCSTIRIPELDPIRRVWSVVHSRFARTVGSASYPPAPLLRPAKIRQLAVSPESPERGFRAEIELSPGVPRSKTRGVDGRAIRAPDHRSIPPPGSTLFSLFILIPRFSRHFHVRFRLAYEPRRAQLAARRTFLLALA